MNTVHGAMITLAIVMGGLACSAQDAPIPFKQLERNAQLSATLAPPPGFAANSYSSSASPSEPLAAGFVRTSPVAHPRTLDAKFYMLNGLHLGVAMLDVSMTQRCIAAHTCREGNPLMPSSLAGQLGVDFALVGYGSLVSYEVKKHRSPLWWLSPAFGTAAHGVGAGMSIAHE